MSAAELETDAGERRTRRRFGWADMILALVFAALFGYFLFVAVSQFVAAPQYYEAFREQTGVDVSTPWALLIAGVVIPVLGFVAAVLVTRGRALPERALVFIVALAAVNALEAAIVAGAQWVFFA